MTKRKLLKWSQTLMTPWLSLGTSSLPLLPPRAFAVSSCPFSLTAQRVHQIRPAKG